VRADQDSLLRCSLLMLRRTLAGGGARGRARGSGSLDLANDFLTARGSLDQLGLEARLARATSLLSFSHQSLQLLLHLSIVGAGLLRRVSSLSGSTSEFFLDQRLLRILGLLLVLDLGLNLGQGHLVVSLGAGLDLTEQLSLTLLCNRELLREVVLGTLLAGTILRSAPLPGELDLVILVARLLLDPAQLLLALRFGGRELLVKLFDDALALGALE